MLGPRQHRCSERGEAMRARRLIDLRTRLLRISAVYALIWFHPILLVVAVLLGAGGYGIANELRWGYTVAVTGAVLQVVFLVLAWGTNILGFPQIISLLFDGALVALLLHPQSREYQRIWFK